MKKVMITGTFDGDIHQGHIHLLSSARSIADELQGVLVVVLAPDWFIKLQKNRNPVYPQIQRMMNIKATNLCDFVIPHMGRNEDENLEQTIQFAPDCYIFGGGQGTTEFTRWNQTLEQRLVENGCIIRRVERLPGISTTELLQNRLAS